MCVRFLSCGDTALVVEFGSVVDRQLSRRVMALARRLEAVALPGVGEVVPTFRSLMVHYDPLATGNAELQARIRPMLADLEEEKEGEARLWELPLCYNRVHAIDLDEIAERTRLSADRIVGLHAGTTFNVYMLGFMPGYAYLGDTPKELYLPRRTNPRPKIPQGSIVIALNQSVIHSLETPGGWYVIGRTPVRTYDLRRDPPIFLKANDKIKFIPISLVEHDLLEARAAAGDLVIEPRPWPL